MAHLEGAVVINGRNMAHGKRREEMDEDGVGIYGGSRDMSLCSKLLAESESCC